MVEVYAILSNDIREIKTDDEERQVLREKIQTFGLDLIDKINFKKMTDARLQ